MADSDAPAGWSSTPPPATSKPKGLDAIHGYFKDKGGFLNPHAADALAAVSYSETGGDPYAVNKSSKAVGGFQWLGPRKAAFLAQGDTSPEGMAKFAMTELPKYKRSWAALNDPNVSRDDLHKVLIDEFEAPGGSAAGGYGEGYGDLKRARAYNPPRQLPGAQPAQQAGEQLGATNDGKQSAPPDAAPKGWSSEPPKAAAPPAMEGPKGWSSEPPGRQDPSIVANTKPPQVEPGKLQQLATYLGSMLPSKSDLASPDYLANKLGQVGELGGRAVDAMLTPTGPLDPLNLIPNREALVKDIKAYLFEGGNLGGPEGMPGLKRPEKPVEAPPVAKAAEAAPELQKAVGDGLTPAQQPARPVTPTPDALGSSVTEAPKPEAPPAPAAAGAAATPLHEIAQQNIRDYEAANKAPGMREKITAYKDYAKGYFSKAEDAKAIIQKNQGEMNQMGHQAKEAMIPFQKFTKSLNTEEQIGMLEWLETPGAKKAKGLELAPEAQGFADTFKKWMQTYREKIASLPGKEQQGFVEEFVTHLYRDSGDAQKAIADYGAKQGSGYFTKGRVFQTYADAIRSGKPLLTTDPMEIFSRYIENASKKVASWESIEDAKQAGNLVYRKTAPEGWKPLKGVQDGMGHNAFAPPGFAEVYNAYNSRAVELTIPGTNIDVLDVASKAANKTTSVKLALSLFHPTLVTMESIASSVADGITKIKNGRPIAGIAEIAKSPGRPLTSFVNGRKAQRAYLTGEYGDATYEKVIQGLVDANYDFMREGGLANEYRFSHLPGFIKGWQKGIPMTAGGPLKTGIRAFETSMEPTFQYYVPWLKNQAAVNRMKTWLDAHPDATREEFAAQGRVVAKQADMRMGEMNKDNVFWNATAKKMAQSAMLSWSFTLGQAQNVLGAAWDAGRVPDRAYRAIKGTKPSTEEIWTDRMSYAVAIPMVYTMVNSLYQYLMTGEGPQNMGDLLNPRTGGTDPTTGKPERATIPNFTNAYRNIWEGGLGQEMFNKLAPLWQTAYYGAENKDFANHPIRNTNDTGAAQIKQLGEFVAKQMVEPIGVGSMRDAKGGSHIDNLQRMFGIKAAGRRDTDPEGLKKAISYKDAEAWYEKQKSDVNAQRAKNGLGPMRIRSHDRQLLIQKYMKDPSAEPLKSYGGTQ